MTINRLKRPAKPFQMKKYLLLLLLCIANCSCFAQVLGGYVPNYYKPADIDNLNLTGVTEIYYALPYETGLIPIFNGSSLQINDATFSELIKVCGKRIKLFLTIQDTNDQYYAAAISANSSFTNNFATACTNYCNANSLSGIDVDWESVAPAHATAFINLMSALHTAFQNSGGALKLSVDVEDYTTSYGVSSTTVSYADYVHLMAYNFTSDQNFASLAKTQAMMTGWANQGVPYSKMIVGFPFYASDKNTTYAQIAGYDNSDSKAYDNDTYVNNGTTIYYNDAADILQKTNYVISKGCLGIFAWQLLQDLPQSSGYSLIAACKQALNGNSGCIDQYEPNNSSTAATSIFGSQILSNQSATISIQGIIPDPSDQDWFRIPVSAQGTLQLKLTNLPADYDLELYPLTGLAGGAIGYSYNSGTTPESITYSYTVPASTVFYAKVYPKSSSQYSPCGPYTLTVSWTPASGTTTNCTPPSAPVANFGADACSQGTAVSGNTAQLTFTGSATAFSAQASQYPYGSTNIIFTSTCQSSSPIQATNLVPGMLYRWNMYAYNSTDCSSCKSAVSNSKYFALAPQISAPNLVIPSGGSVTLSSPAMQPGAGSSVNYRWLLNGSPYQSGTTLNSISVQTPGTYTLIIDYSGSSDCSVTSSTPISNSLVVTNNNSCTASTAPNSVNQQVTGNSYVLTETGGSLGTGATWKWYQGQCGSGTYLGAGSTITVNPTATTSYYVRAEGTCGITDCASTTIIITPCTASVIPDYITQQLSEDGKSLSLIIVGGSLGSGATWRWYTGSCGGTFFASGAANSIIVDPTVNGTYYVRAESSCGNTDCVNTTVTNCIPSVKPDSLSQIKTPNGYILLINGGSLGTNSSWYFTRDECQGGTPAGSGRADTIRVHPTQTTTYFVRAVGCSGQTDCVSTTIEIYPPPVITGFTPTSAITGTTVNINGSGLTGTSAVSFGGVPATSFKVANDNTVTAVVGQGLSGNVGLSAPGGFASDTGFHFVFELPPDNFSISTASASCRDKADGSLTITANQLLNYTAILTGPGGSNNYTFDGTLNVSNLAGGTYQLCLTVEGQPGFQQCYTLKIGQPAVLAVIHQVDSLHQTMQLHLSGGTTYYIHLGNADFTTQDSLITLPLSAGDNALSVRTMQSCQGNYSAIIQMPGPITAYPVPFHGALQINLALRRANKGIFSVRDIKNGTVVYSQTINNVQGTITLPLSNLAQGVYALYIDLDGKKTVQKIIKQ